MDKDETFTVVAGMGEITFWKTKEGYMRQCAGVGEPTRTTKQAYEEALLLYQNQQNGN